MKLSLFQTCSMSMLLAFGVTAIKIQYDDSESYNLAQTENVLDSYVDENYSQTLAQTYGNAEADIYAFLSASDVSDDDIITDSDCSDDESSGSSLVGGLLGGNALGGRMMGNGIGLGNGLGNGNSLLGANPLVDQALLGGKSG